MNATLRRLLCEVGLHAWGYVFKDYENATRQPEYRLCAHCDRVDFNAHSKVDCANWKRVHDAPSVRLKIAEAEWDV